MSITIKDIASELGVSSSTVSAVLGHKNYCYASEKTKILIHETAKRMGYVPDMAARRLRGGSSRSIGIIGALNCNDVNIVLIEELSARLMDEGYHCFVANCQGERARQENIVRDYLARGVDAIVLCANRHITPPENVCFININVNGDDGDLRIDREYGAYLLTGHLIREHGHRRIGLVATSLAGNRGKLEGYQKALADNGIGVEPELLVEYSHDGSPEQVLELIGQGVRAFACCSDLLAAHLIGFLQMHNIRVPDDVAVTGFDDTVKTRHAMPGLTTVSQPVRELARRAVKELTGRLQRKSPLQAVPPLPCRLVVRGSCGCHYNPAKDLNDILSFEI